MATNTNLKGRGFVKRVRDGVKTNYVKAPGCDICGSDEDLELHHFCSVSQMVNKWLKKEKIDIETDQDSLDHRDAFIEEHWDELTNQCATLCNTHHKRLHKIYGPQPTLATAKKQARWVIKQKEKNI
jgi:hypothetical protein